MKALLLLLVASTAAADPLPDVVAHKLALPSGLGVVQVFAPADDVDASKVIVEAPRDARPGRASIKVTVGKKVQWIQVAVGPIADVYVATHALATGATLTAADVSTQQRAVERIDATNVVGAVLKHDVSTGDAITGKDVAPPPPIARGTKINITVHQGGLTIRGTAVLEAAAHVGEPASARVAATHTVVRGTLVAADQLEVTP